MDRRSAKALAALSLSVIATSLPGCRLFPGRRPPPRPEASSPTVVFPPLPVIPPEVQPPTPQADPPTPVLDAALARDEAIRRVALAEVQAPLAPIQSPPPAPELLPVSVQVASEPEPDALKANKSDFTPKTPRKADEPPAVVPAIASPPTPLSIEGTAPGRSSDPEPPVDRPAAPESKAPSPESEAVLVGVEQLVGALASSAEASEAPEPARPLDLGSKTVENVAFAVGGLRVCRQVRGAGRFDAIDPASIGAGEPTLLYAEIAGLRAEGENPFRTRVSLRVELIAEGRDRPTWEWSVRDDRATADRPPAEGFLNCRFTPPRTLAPGPYRLRLVVRDEVAGRESEGGLALTIRP